MVCFLMRPDLVFKEDGRELTEEEGPEKVWACLRARSSSRVMVSRGVEEEEEAWEGREEEE